MPQVLCERRVTGAGTLIRCGPGALDEALSVTIAVMGKRMYCSKSQCMCAQELIRLILKEDMFRYT